MSYNFDVRTELRPHKGKLFKTAYSPKLQISLSFPEHSPHTRQEFADECDINTIMARYQRTGEMPQLNLTAPQYLDVTGVDFRAQMEFIAGAQTMFEELPSQIRNRFNNDPASFLDFCSQEQNRTEMAKMGLLSPEATKAVLSPTPPPKNDPAVSQAAPAPAE